jgi:hypothetical protein
MKLSAGQLAVLRHVAQNPATCILETAGYTSRSIDFWASLKGASPNSFHSLVKRGLLRVEQDIFHYITE